MSRNVAKSIVLRNNYWFILWHCWFS